VSKISEPQSSGWCLSGKHNGCPIVFVREAGEKLCPCHCHDTPQNKGT